MERARGNGDEMKVDAHRYWYVLGFPDPEYFDLKHKSFLQKDSKRGSAVPCLVEEA